MPVRPWRGESVLTDIHYICTKLENMKKTLLALSLCFWMAWGYSRTYDLRCEAMTSPLGIDSVCPHFSWKNTVPQASYRLQVASSIERLEGGTADLWDSGEKHSSQSIMVPYEGKRLHSRDLCWWRVSVDGVWSDPQRFSIGILDADTFPGEYIGAFPGEGKDSPIVYTTFRYTDFGKTAFLHVNSLGYHEVYINGVRISDAVLAPAVSQMDVRSQILTYDVTPFLHRGKNDIAIWIGAGWYNARGFFKAEFEGPLVRSCLEVLGKDGWETVLRTDSSWRAVRSGYSDTSLWYSGDYGGEQIDAALVPESLSSAFLDRMGPVHVETVDVTGPAATPQMCRNNAIMETVPARSIEPCGEGRWIVDMGRVMNAMTRVHLRGQEPSDTVLIKYSDAEQNRGEGLKRWGCDILICSGRDDGDTFESRFNHHVFRYVILEGVRTRPALEDVEAVRFGTCTSKGGSFHCSDPDLDRIHDMVAVTMSNLAFSGYMVDCASIERLGYGGDGNASTLSLQTIYDVQDTYVNWLQAWIDTQGEDGHLRHTAPSPVGAGGGPYWCSFIVQAPWRLYMDYGDRRMIERCYPSMLKWIGYVDRYSSGGLLKKWPEDERRSWYLGDWLAPKGTDVTAEESVDLVNNCAMVQTYDDLVRIAALLGKDGDREDFTRRKESLCALIHKTFYHEKEGIYGTGSQLDMIYPLLTGVTPPDLVKTVEARLFERTDSINGGHIGVGLVGVPVLAEWAARSGNADYVYSMLKQRSYPGYLYMLDNGATTTWEDWDTPRSHLHNCYNGIGSWFYQALGGIIQDEPGYSHVTIAPQFPTGLSWVRVSQETPYGTVCVAWEKDPEGDVTVHVTIPPGVSATIPDGRNVSAGSYDVIIHGA